MKQKFLLGGTLAIVFTLFSLAFASHSPLLSSPPTLVKDVLDNAQLSYFARIGIGPTAGDSLITINVTSGSAPSTTTNNLFIGDTIAIGTTGAGVGISGPLTSYYIKDIGSTGTILLNTGIGQSNAFLGAAIIATRSAQHVISFTPQSNLTGGYWQFLIKASSRTGEVYNDGIPDQEGFDIGASTPSNSTGVGARIRTSDIVCPNFGAGTNAFNVGTTAVITNSTGTFYYNVITCQLGAGNTNQVGVGYSLAIGLNSTSPELINPSASDNSHIEGKADTYTFYVRHLDNGQNVVSADTMQGKIAVVESVRVTATVDPSITFQIGTSGVASGKTVCGITLGTQADSVTGDAVPFGSLSIGAFNDLAQWLSCSTNSTTGYAVTVYHLHAMNNSNIGDNTTIPDTTCPSNSCTTSNPALWTTNAASGWGYTIQNINVGQTAFSYTLGYKPFAVGASAAKTIMSNPVTPSAPESAFVCYRLTASTSQEAGNYEDKLVYTATATF